MSGAAVTLACLSCDAVAESPARAARRNAPLHLGYAHPRVEPCCASRVMSHSSLQCEEPAGAGYATTRATGALSPLMRRAAHPGLLGRQDPGNGDREPQSSAGIAAACGRKFARSNLGAGSADDVVEPCSEQRCGGTLDNLCSDLKGHSLPCGHCPSLSFARAPKVCGLFAYPISIRLRAVP